MKDTARLIMFLDCNLDCPYCCNKRDEVFNKFQHKGLTAIDFTLYKNICITGGEPFYRKYDLYGTLSYLKTNYPDKNIYINSNGLLIDRLDIKILKIHFPGVKGINIGLHSVEHVRKVIDVEHDLPVRFLINDNLKEQYLLANPGRLNDGNSKTWTMNKCDRDNEDWFFLNL